MFISFSCDANLTKLISFDWWKRETVHRNLAQTNVCLVKVNKVEHLQLELIFRSCMLAHSCTLAIVAIALAGVSEPLITVLSP